MPLDFRPDDVVAEFGRAFPDAGLVAPPEIIPDGEWHRCDVAGKRPRNDDGRYKLYADRWPAGVLQNFVEGAVVIWHPEDRGRKISDAERAERKRFYDQARAEAEAALVELQQKVAEDSEWHWSAMVECTEHAYLTHKRVCAYGLRTSRYGRTLIYVPIRDIDGKLWSLQTIWPDGTKEYPYRGRITGCFHTIGELVDGEPIQISEGYATGATAFEVNATATVVALDSGNLLHVAKAIRNRYPNSPIVLLADDDAKTEQERGRNPGIEKATEAAIAVGGKIAIPDFGADRRDEWTDFNDLHCSAGPDVVRQQIEAAREPEGLKATYLPPADPVPIEQAREQLNLILDEFMATALAWCQPIPHTANGHLDFNAHAPVDCVRVPPGTGKTTGVLEKLVPAAVKAGKQILIAVPTHKLGKQLVDHLAALGVTARIYQARGANDLENLGQTMCLETERVEAIQGALGEVSRLACKRGDNVCKFYESCGYQRQQRQPKPQVWVIPHNCLFYALPSFIPKPDIVVIDEGFVGGCFEDDVIVELNEIVDTRVWPKDGHDVGNEADLQAIAIKVYQRLQALLSEQKRCRVRRDIFGGAVTVDDAKLAHKLEWARKLEIDDVVPGMPVEQAVERARRRMEHNQLVNRLRKFWEKLAVTLEQDAELSLYLRVDRECGIPFSDRTANGVIVASRRELHSDITRCSILHADAFLSDLVVRQFFPRVTFHEVAVKWPPMTTVAIKQATDRVISKSANSELVLEECRRLVESEAVAANGRPVGVITLKHIERALKRDGSPLPPNVRLAHYGAITGLNDLSDVTTLLLIGRPEAAPYTLEKQARLLWRREVQEVARYYPMRQRGLAVRHSADVVPVEGYYHPDPAVESLRWLACEAELMQALHRARPLNRTAANPLLIIVATNVALPAEIDLSTTWDGLQPTLFEIMLARGGAVPMAYRDMAVAYDDLFESAEAARAAHARERKNPGRFPYWISFKGIVRGFRRMYFPLRPAGCHRELTGVFLTHYRRVGARGPAVPLAFDPDRVPDPLAWLRSNRIGDAVLIEPEPEQGEGE